MTEAEADRLAARRNAESGSIYAYDVPVQRDGGEWDVELQTENPGFWRRLWRAWWGS